MSQQANVTSVEAIEAFRASLILFLDKANRSLHDVSDQVSRMRNWTQVEQSQRWKAECRRRKQALDQAESELFSAKLSSWQDSAAQLKMMVSRCSRSLEEAETRLRHVKRWSREYDRRVDPLAKKVETLQHIIDQDMPKALAYLDNAAGHLHAYAESFAPPTSTGAGPSSAAPDEVTETKADDNTPSTPTEEAGP